MMRRGFTLIETIIYIGLFSLLIGTIFITIYGMISNTGTLGKRIVVQNEGNFIIRKINWAMTGVQTILTPSSGTTSKLRLIKYDGTKVEICLDENKIKIHEGTFGSCNNSSYTPLTTDNVFVSALVFELLPADNARPAGIKSTITITQDEKAFDFSKTKYLRK